MSNKIRLFGVDIDVLDMLGTLWTLERWIDRAEVSICRYVVTPNVQHIVRLSEDSAFRKAYASASLVVTDGKPVLAAARLFGLHLPETVPGSDLVPALFTAYSTKQKPLRVHLLGAGPGVAARASVNIEAQWSSVRVVGFNCPPLGFEHDAIECERICSEISALNCDVLVIGLGAPKQELWIANNASRLNAKIALCVGATIDFLANERSRAPEWVRSIGFEWLYRTMCEPRRLAKRYVHDGFYFAKICIKEWYLRRF